MDLTSLENFADLIRQSVQIESDFSKFFEDSIRAGLTLKIFYLSKENLNQLIFFDEPDSLYIQAESPGDADLIVIDTPELRDCNSQELLL